MSLLKEIHAIKSSYGDRKKKLQKAKHLWTFSNSEYVVVISRVVG